MSNDDFIPMPEEKGGTVIVNMHKGRCAKSMIVKRIEPSSSLAEIGLIRRKFEMQGYQCQLRSDAPVCIK